MLPKANLLASFFMKLNEKCRVPTFQFSETAFGSHVENGSTTEQALSYVLPEIDLRICIQQLWPIRLLISKYANSSSFLIDVTADS